jgi:hypothetical protein
LIANHLPFSRLPFQGNAEYLGTLSAVSTDGCLMLIELGRNLVACPQPDQAVQ